MVVARGLLASQFVLHGLPARYEGGWASCHPFWLWMVIDARYWLTPFDLSNDTGFRVARTQ